MCVYETVLRMCDFSRGVRLIQVYGRDMGVTLLYGYVPLLRVCE